MSRKSRRNALRQESQSELEQIENQFESAVNAVSADESDRVVWRFDTGGDVYSSPTVIDGTVFIGSENEQLYAIDAASGSELWTHDPNRPVRSAPTVYDDLVIAGTYGNKIVAVEAATGDERWEFVEYVRHFIWDKSSSATVANGIAYIGFGDGTVYALAAESGQVGWEFSVGESVPTSPTVVDGTVFIASGGGTMYAIDGIEGEEIWSYEIGSDITSSPTVSEGTVFIGVREQEEENVYAFDADDGELEWASHVPPKDGEQSRGDVWGSPTVHDGFVYVGLYQGTNATFFALDTETGDLEWQTGARGFVKSSPTVVDDTVYVASMHGYIMAFNADTGGERWVIQVDGRVVSSPTVVDGILYVANESGRVYAIETDSAGSSNGSRVSLGTLGHHGSFDGIQPPSGVPESESGSGSASGSNSEDNNDSDAGSTNDSDGETGTTDGTSSDDGMPGPGIVGSLASLGGASYLFGRYFGDDDSEEE